MSELTFLDVASKLPYIKVYWNDRLVFDDDIIVSRAQVQEFEINYGFRKISSMRMEVADFHHLILYVYDDKI